LGAIYAIENVANNKIYIGSTVSPFVREQNHFSYLRNNKHPNKHLQNSFNKHGEESFDFKVLEEARDSDLIKREQHYIDIHNPQFNILKIAGSNLGFRFNLTEEQKEKVKNSTTKRLSIPQNNPMYGKRGKDNPRYGKRHTKESIRKMSLAKKKHWECDEYREKVSKTKKGERHHHAKLKESDIEVIRGLLENGLTMKEVGEQFNVSPSVVCNIKNGKAWKHI